MIDASARTSTFLRPPERVIGNYEILNKIGKGAYGTVYRGKHRATKQVVAIKEISREHKKVSLEAIRKEARLLLRLQHPNIAQLLGFYNDESNFYLILEYCPHGDLLDFIAKNFPKKCVPEFQARKLAQHIVSAIRAMHEHNVVHRDLKLENILIGEDYVAKLADFGLGRSAEDSDVLTTYCGTPLMMAPEVVGRVYDAKCDIWSLGIMLYEILYGKVPFRGPLKTRGDILRAISEPDWLQFPKTVAVTEEAKDLISKMLIVDPKDRIDFEDLFAHPWITGQSSIPVPEEVLQLEAQLKENQEETKMVLNQIRDESRENSLFWYENASILNVSLFFLVGK